MALFRDTVYGLNRLFVVQIDVLVCQITKRPASEYDRLRPRGCEAVIEVIFNNRGKNASDALIYVCPLWSKELVFCTGNNLGSKKLGEKHEGIALL